MKKVVIIGGGAAGFFTANNLEHNNINTTLIEKTSKTLMKVKVSGGGRCNVTHHEFNPRPLSDNYPRGHKKLKSPFSLFNPQDTIEWFKERGIELKTEPDGRIFPISNDSQTIVDCLRNVTSSKNFALLSTTNIISIDYKENWQIITDSSTITCDYLVVCTGSDKQMMSILERDTNHTIVPQVPSLFTFKISDPRLNDLQGIAFSDVTVRIQGSKLTSEGPLLITHWGMSGPATLKLSAWGARELSVSQYNFKVMINFVKNHNFDEVLTIMKSYRDENKHKSVAKHTLFNIPKRYWVRLCEVCDIGFEKPWIDMSKKHLNKLATELTQAEFSVSGKSTFKDEFVTAGGISLSEINFSNFESRLHPNLYFAGEVLDIDAITGGFNFQACWTGGALAAQDIVKKVNRD